MDLTKDLPGFDVKLYRPEAGDVLVVNVPETFTMAEYQQLREAVAETCVDLGVKAMVLSRGCTLDIVRKD